jgi:hypothetical protein
LPRQIICLGPDFFSHACADRSSSPAPSLDSRTVLVRHPVRSEVFISFTREAVRRPRLLAVFFLCGRHVPRSRSSRRLDSFPVFRSRSQFPARRPTSGVRCAHPRCVFDLSTAVPFSFATRDYAARRFWQPVSRCFVFSCDSCSSTRGFFGSCARFVLPHDSIQTSRQSASGLLLILPSPVLFSDRACPVLVSPGPFPARLGFCSGKLEFGPGPRGPDWLQFLLPRSRFLSISFFFRSQFVCAHVCLSPSVIALHACCRKASFLPTLLTSCSRAPVGFSCWRRSKFRGLALIFAARSAECASDLLLPRPVRSRVGSRFVFLCTSCKIRLFGQLGLNLILSHPIKSSIKVFLVLVALL